MGDQLENYNDNCSSQACKKTSAWVRLVAPKMEMKERFSNIPEWFPETWNLTEVGKKIERGANGA